jgi:hypothetical protein
MSGNPGIDAAACAVDCDAGASDIRGVERLRAGCLRALEVPDVAAAAFLAMIRSFEGVGTPISHETPAMHLSSSRRGPRDSSASIDAPAQEARHVARLTADRERL